MAIAVIKLGNHKIQFEGRTFNDLSSELKMKLDNSGVQSSDAVTGADSKNRSVALLDKADMSGGWYLTLYNESRKFDVQQGIDFSGPFDMQITFHPHKIHFWKPAVKYHMWFDWEEDKWRDEWRKYMYQIVILFGGNRVIYFPDSYSELANYDYYQGTFEEMESEIRSKFGPPKHTIHEVPTDFENGYYIDKFEDIRKR